MTSPLTDVQVCLPGRGCVYYVPGAGQALNAAIAIGPQVVDACLGAVLGLLVLVAVGASVLTLRNLEHAREHASRAHPADALAAALFVAGGALGALPLLMPAVASVAGVFGLCASSCVGAALLVLAVPMPRLPRAALTIAGGLRLLSLPVCVVQFVLAAPLGPFPSDVVSGLGGLSLWVAGAVLVVAGRGPAALRWALLLPPSAALLTRIRLGLPFPGTWWSALLPDVAVVVVGLLVLAPRPELAPAAVDGRRSAAVIGGSAAALAVTLGVLVGWPASATDVRGAGEPVIGPVRAVTAATHVVLPLDRYRQRAAGRDVVLRAENTIIGRCASRHGMTVHAADLLPPEDDDLDSVLLGLIDHHEAATDGYWSPPPAVASGASHSTSDLGVLAQCVRTARARVGDDGNAQSFVRGTAFTAQAHTDADSRVRRLQAAWSRCMQLRGSAFPSPMAVAATQEVAFPTPDDTRAATASVDCEQVTNLPGVRVAVLAAYERRAIATHGEQLGAARSAVLAEERAADAALRVTPR